MADQQPATPESASDLIYVPGLLRCKKCGFELSKRTLNMAVGTITANNDPDICPNDGSPMWRVSEREYREQLFNDLLATRNDTLDFAARVCRDLIEKMNARGRLQARAILEDCAKELEGRKTERPIARSESAPRTWIPVGERLPDDDITVMVACKDCDEPAWLGYHDENGWWSATDGVPLTKLVTHWRPVIEGPTKEDRRATGIR